MLLKRCPACKKYTIKDICSACNKKAITAYPLKFSIEKERKYGKYRRQRFKLGETKSV
ncbi:MAG: ribosome biogenesis protein [Candidatus Aenigmarchaeota archaeon]|nr:ribosome biogenesis protein [Candidatus Aenigmarchaeota archaeon]